MADCSSDSSSCSGGGIATRSKRKAAKAVGIKLIMKKLKKQKRLYKRMEKIFVS